MLDPAEILDAARAKWPAVLRAEAAGENLFPLQIPFGRPRTTTDLAVIRSKLDALARDKHHWYIEWEDINTRKWGHQRWPARITFKSVEELASALHLSGELKAFREALRTARYACPALEPWLRAKAHRIPDYLEDWDGLVAVCAYFDANPQPRCYARQLPIPVGTKFIEDHAAILRELLDVVLGTRANPSGLTFADRFNLLVDAPQVRVRFLDLNLQTQLSWPVTDCSIPLPELANLSWKIPRVLVVENRVVFLCLPMIPGTLAVLGNGKAAALLPKCPWMTCTDVVYWGDCDEAGYGILSALRLQLPHVRSLFMDEDTWRHWKHLAVAGRRDPAALHTHLTDTERAVLAAVRSGPWMLEQEKIPHFEVERVLQALFG